MLGIGLQEVILLLPLVAIYLLASVTLVPFVASAKGRSGLASSDALVAMSSTRHNSLPPSRMRGTLRTRRQIRWPLRMAGLFVR
jgi:hypothetical protein